MRQCRVRPCVVRADTIPVVRIVGVLARCAVTMLMVGLVQVLWASRVRPVAARKAGLTHGAVSSKTLMAMVGVQTEGRIHAGFVTEMENVALAISIVVFVAVVLA